MDSSPFAGWPPLTSDDAALLRRTARSAPAVDVDALQRTAASLTGGAVGVALRELHVTGADEVAEPCVAVVLEKVTDAGTARMAVELSAELAGTILDTVLGGDGASVAAVSPLRDGERGVLLYVAAKLVAAAAPDFHVVTVITTRGALTHLGGGGRFARWDGIATVGERHHRVALWIPEAALDRWGEARGPRSMDDVPLRCSVETGRGRITVADLATVARGDVLIPDEMWRDRARLVVGTVAAFWATPTDRGLRIDSRDGARRPTEGTVMETEHTATRTDGTAGALNVELTVELATFTLPVAEAAKLGPGEVVATGAPLGRTVTVKAGGRPFAQGELVEVDGELGIRLTALHPR